jgi:hypothetical protein
MHTHLANPIKPVQQGPKALADLVPSELLAVGGPVYDPPYETPLEDELAWHLVKYLKRQTALHSQVQVTTPGAVFWADFVLVYQGQRIAVECGALNPAEDGATVDEEDDRLRAAMLIGSGAFDVLYCVRGADLFHHMEDVLFLLSKWHPGLFTDRAHLNLERLASSTVKAALPAPTGPVVEVMYPGSAEEHDDGQQMRIRCLRRLHPSDWLDDYDLAMAHFGADALARSA